MVEAAHEEKRQTTYRGINIGTSFGFGCLTGSPYRDTGFYRVSLSLSCAASLDLLESWSSLKIANANQDRHQGQNRDDGWFRNF